MKKPNMTKIEQIEHFQTRVHKFSLLMPIGDSHHHTLYIMYASRFKSPKKKQTLLFVFNRLSRKLLYISVTSLTLSRRRAPSREKFSVAHFPQTETHFSQPVKVRNQRTFVQHVTIPFQCLDLEKNQKNTPGLIFIWSLFRLEYQNLRHRKLKIQGSENDSGKRRGMECDRHGVQVRIDTESLLRASRDSGSQDT